MMTWVLELPNSSVSPLGVERATSVAPITPPPPPLFSVTTVPNLAFIRSAQSRPTTSVAPPGENGTISLIGRSGNAANAGIGKVVAASEAIPYWRTSRRFIVLPWQDCGWDFFHMLTERPGKQPRQDGAGFDRQSCIEPRN